MVIAATLCCAACTRDQYDSGDGDYSYLRADFATVNTSASKIISGAVTDDNDTLTFSPYKQCDWATTADSSYRALLYYNAGNDLKQTEVITVAQIPVMQMIYNNVAKEVCTDPIIFESAWISKNIKYLNIGFSLKTGSTSGTDQKQSIGIICDSIVTGTDGSHIYYLKMAHKQNGVPEYYSTKGYASMPLSTEMGKSDKIVLTVNTYDGLTTKILNI